MNSGNLFEIAKIIDNEFIGKEKTFSAGRRNGYWYLATNVCDYAGFIKVWETNNKISSIQVLMPDEDSSWRPIHSGTWDRIEKYLESLNIKSPV